MRFSKKKISAKLMQDTTQENVELAGSKIDPVIHESWKTQLKEEFSKPYFSEIKAKLISAKEESKMIYPPGSLIFNAFNSTPFDKVKVVIIGQDPYHGPGQAHGLCFSVKDGINPPPSLVNIYKELNTDINLPIPTSGSLQAWAEQGVFLLNAILTVEAHKPASHRDLGWEQFTDAVIRKLSSGRTGIIFLLWGKFAREKRALIDVTRHAILESPHPSPFSAQSGFFGSAPFSNTNKLLQEQGLSPINWSV